MAEEFSARALTYRTAEKTVIREVSLSLGPGELVALIGPNGAGNQRCCVC